MAVVFDPFTGQLIDVGPTGMVIGGTVAGADQNSVLIVDNSYTLQDVQLTDGQLVTSQAGTLVASSITGNNSSQISVDYITYPNEIRLSLPQDISTTDSPEFAGLTLTGFSGPVKATAGVLSASAIDLASSEVTGILPIANGGTNLSITPTNGQLLIGNGTDYTLANITSSTLSTNPDRIIITNTSGGIDLDLPQNINTTSSPEFANVYLSPNGSFDLSSAGTLNIGATATTINIGNGVTPGNINLYGNTFYQQVTNLEVSDKNILLNKNGASASGFDSGISVEENGSVTGYAQVSSDRNSWQLKAPNAAGNVTLSGGASGITLDESTSSLLPLSGSRSMTGNLDLNNHTITNVTAGVNTGDAVNVGQLNTISNYADQQIVYVSKNGNDSTGTGGQHKPFLTVQTAINAITDASSSKKYIIRIAPGTYSEAITLKPYVNLQGMSKESVVITIPTASSITLSARGRVWVEGISFNGSGSINIATGALSGSGTVVEFRECGASNTGGFTFTGRGAGSDYVQFRNFDVTRAVNVSGASVTIFESSLSVSTNLQTGGTVANSYGELLDVYVRNSYIATLSVTANSGESAFFQGQASKLDGTTTLSGSGLSGEIDAISYPNTISLVGSPSITKVTKISSVSYDNSLSGLSAINGQDAIDELALRAINQDLVTKEPTGFPTRTDSSISFNNATRTFSIQPIGVSYDFYIKGQKFTKTGIDSVSIPAPYNTGEYYIYFDSSGTLVITDTFNTAIITDNAYVSIVYWNETAGSRVYFAEERHGLTMDGTTHVYLHTVFGARYLSGGALQNFQPDGTGNSNADAQFTSDSGSIRDEDLLIQYIAQSQVPILYRIGTSWYKKTADSFPIIYSGTAGYTGVNGLLPYNQLSAGVWSLTEVQNNKFVLVHVFATNDIDNPVVAIQGIAEYNSVADARTAASTEITTISGLPFAEFVALGSVVFETSTTYTNTPKARVRSVNGGNYVDFRGTQPYAPQYATASSHSILSNLSSDDHLQYLNRDGSRAMEANLSIGNNRVVDVSDPIDPQDAATKIWVENLLNDELDDVYATYYDNVSTSLPSTIYTVDGNLLAYGDRVLFSALLSSNNLIYKATAGILPGFITWVLDTSFVAEEGDVVSIKKGTIFGSQFAKFDGTTFQINNYVRYFNGSDYSEQSSPITSALANNTTNNVFTIPFLNSENIIVDYSIVRGTSKVTGTLNISTNGTDVAIADTGAELGSVGVTFDASISGSDILLDCITDNSGSAGSIKYATRRWSDTAGGPAGLPSYSTTTVVSSVGLSMPTEFTVTNSPVTSSGTLTVTKASQTANKVYASPNGSSGAPTFRSLVVDDIPLLNQNTTGTASNVTGIVAITNGGTGQTTANAGLNALLPSQSTHNGKYLQTNGTNTSWESIPVSKTSYFDYVVGSSSNVTAGIADFSSLQDALDAIDPLTGGTILLLKSYLSASNVTIQYSNTSIYGQGRNSLIGGDIAFASNVSGCVIESVKVKNITLNVGNNYNYITKFWIPNTFTITDNGTSNYIVGIQE